MRLLRKCFVRSCLSFFLVLILQCSAHAATWSSGSRSSAKKTDVPSELDIDANPEKIFAKNFRPKRTTPVFKDAFSVGFVLIVFPDTRMPDVASVKKRLFNFGPMTITDYFKEYSQNICWPVPIVMGEEVFPKCVYKAPHPLGYYCEKDSWTNPLGFQNRAEGNERANILREEAKKHAFKMYKRPPPGAGIPLQANGKPHLICYAFATKLVSSDQFKQFIEPHYNGRKYTGTDKDAWPGYKPKIPWSDPLWPNSIPQVHVEGGGGTVCHELGHVLGAPDYYHAPEKFDGVPGKPSLPWAYGPTGPGYCRVIYNAYLSTENYPMYTKSGTYVLRPRNTNPAGNQVVGCFIPSSHPHYLYCLEYVKGESAPLGNPNKQGLLISVINTTLKSPLLGAPDLCYVYRPNDPWFRSKGDIDNALFGKASGRFSFSSSTEPSSRLPNLLDGGVTIDNIKEAQDSVSFDVTVTQKMLSRKDYIYSLVPKIKLDEINEIMPTSINAESTVTFRGEPMKSDYGFCWNTMPRPRIPTGSRLSANAKYFPLYHRDRYGARITGLRPKTKYYVRAYARNSQGVSYSDEELMITTLSLDAPPASVPPLLQDKFSKNWSIEKYHGFAADEVGDFIGSTAPTCLLKLTAYYRRPLSPDSAKSGRGRSEPIDYTRIHTSPSESRPPFRMKEFNEALKECAKLAKQANMRRNKFGDGFEKDFADIFDLKVKRTAKIKPVEDLTQADFERLEPAIKQSLINSEPVLVGLESVQLSPRGHGLSWVIIDGFNENGQYHIVYPRGHDRDFKNVKTGWHPIDILLKSATKTKVMFGVGADAS